MEYTLNLMNTSDPTTSTILTVSRQGNFPGPAHQLCFLGVAVEVEGKGNWRLEVILEVELPPSHGASCDGGPTHLFGPDIPEGRAGSWGLTRAKWLVASGRGPGILPSVCRPGRLWSRSGRCWTSVGVASLSLSRPGEGAACPV